MKYYTLDHRYNIDVILQYFCWSAWGETFCQFCEKLKREINLILLLARVLFAMTDFYCFVYFFYCMCFVSLFVVLSIKWLRYDEINQLVMIAHWHETWSSNVVVINIVEIVMNLVVKINQLINQLHVLLNSTEIWLTLPRFMVHPRKSISSK